MKLKKNINLGKIKFFKLLTLFYLFIFILFFNLNIKSSENKVEEFLKIKILDKVSSKNTNFKIKIGEEKRFKDLLIKVLKCKNSEFDDNPEITAYIQVKDTNNKSNDEVFVFNGWTFSSSPSLRPFDHPVYDIWLIECF